MGHIKQSALPQSLTEEAVSCSVTWLKVKNHVNGLTIMRHLLTQTSQVELVLNIVLINLSTPFLSCIDFIAGKLNG